jgi:hypothetical protein
MTPKQLKDTLARRAKIHAYMRKLAVTPVKKTVFLTEQEIADNTNEKWGTDYTRQRVHQVVKKDIHNPHLHK